MNPVEQLLQRPDIWRPGDRRAPPQNGMVTGYPAFDRLLHSGGWPRSGLVEMAVSRCEIGELRLLMPALAEISEQGLWQVWIDPPLLPFASAWSHLERQPGREYETLQQLAHWAYRITAEVGHGRFVRIAGIVTGRQRPGTESGVIFLTLEDERVIPMSSYGRICKYAAGTHC